MDKNTKQNKIGFLSKQKYEEGYQLALQNSKSHINVAMEAARIKEYGIANGLLILSAEELAKAFILKVKALDNKLPINNLYKYFENHRTKQESIIKLVISIYVKEFTKNNNQDIEENKKSNISNNQLLGLLLLIGIFITIVDLFYTKKSSNTNKTGKNQNTNSIIFFDEIKESGFYLGFDFKTKLWKAPLEINTEQKFKKYKKLLESTFKLVEKAIFKEMNVFEDAIVILDAIEDKNIDRNYLMKIKKKTAENK